MEARDVQAVFNLLRSQQIVPNAKKIREKGTGLEMEIKVPRLTSPIKGKDVVIFTRQFATMVDAGLPIVQALDILAKQGENKAFRKVLALVKEHV
ncbi:MAG: type II secretion system F family protein, partial [Proteobacteria bacterium]|nr:type II secretion system F family protein [Pseudomonadota bacterium]